MSHVRVLSCPANKDRKKFLRDEAIVLYPDQTIGETIQ